MARVTGAELLRQMRELAGAVTFSVGSSPSICHISSQGPAWDAGRPGGISAAYEPAARLRR